jgi:hypothetical protein
MIADFGRWKNAIIWVLRMPCEYNNWYNTQKSEPRKLLRMQLEPAPAGPVHHGGDSETAGYLPFALSRITVHL